MLKLNKRIMENNTLFKKRLLKKNLSPVFEDESKTTKVAKGKLTKYLKQYYNFVWFSFK
jgi:hypothetical protein